ncbi:MAG TPA: thiosulfate oxidation carrier protein SoxY [Burkholderiales bacterium]|nr:thiosulfate oxidation carrier protein SoxY [Burkholderiales bacterium]
MLARFQWIPVFDRKCEKGDASRRRAMLGFAAGATLLVLRPGLVLADELEDALKDAFGMREIRRGRVKLEMPRIAENGNVVPVTISVESPMTPDDHVRGIHLFAQKNRVPRVFDVELGPWNGKAVVSSRVRVAMSQQIVAVAAMADGSLWSGAADVEVVTSDCGL